MKDSDIEEATNTTIVHSVSEFIENVLSLPVEDNFIERNAVYYRGQSNKSWELKPSISRIPLYDVDTSLERELIERAKNELPDIFADPDLSPVELLTLLQHSGVPTRLLDITENPLVALYFACVDSDNDVNELSDGEVIQFQDTESTECVTPWENAIADSCHLMDGNEDLLAFANSAVEKSYFSGNKNKLESAEEKSIINHVKLQCSFPTIITSKAHLDRQVSQRGHYILFPNSIDENQGKFTQKIKTLSKNDSRVKCRYIIPKECKENILRDLDRLGINESTLYPDSVDHICSYLTRKTKLSHSLPYPRRVVVPGPEGNVTMLIYGGRGKQ